MMRTLCLGFLVMVIAGCTPAPERVPPKLLPDNSPPLSYADLFTRARQQATAATDAFYVNGWSELEEDARGLEQTAGFLTKAIDVPARHKDTLAVMAKDLGTEAANLREAAKAAATLREGAKAQEVEKITNCLQKIQLKVREMRLEN